MIAIELIAVPKHCGPEVSLHPDLTNNDFPDNLTPAIRLDLQCFDDYLRSSQLWDHPSMKCFEGTITIFENDEPLVTYAHRKTWLQHASQSRDKRGQIIRKSSNLTFIHVKCIVFLVMFAFPCFAYSHLSNVLETICVLA